MDFTGVVTRIDAAAIDARPSVSGVRNFQFFPLNVRSFALCGAGSFTIAGRTRLQRQLAHSSVALATELNARRPPLKERWILGDRS
jgi:hypothetical protein